MRGDRRESAERRALHRAQQPGRRRHERHRRARARQHRPARVEAGDGRQGRAVQEVRGHRRVRHRTERVGPAQARRRDRRARADLRRDQPRGHQGARLLHRRARSAQADEDSGVPRRPARHRDRRGRGRHERPEGRRQGHQEGEAGRVGRRRGRARVSRPAGRHRPAAREHHGDRPGRRGVQGPSRADGPGQGAVRARNRRTHARRGDGRRRHLPRPVGRRRAEAGDGEGHGRTADDPRAREPDARDPARTRARSASGRRAGHRPHRLSEPGQQRAVLPVHLPRRTRRRRDDDHARDGDCGGQCDRRACAARAERHRRDRVRDPGSVVRPRIPDSEAVRPAPDRQDRAGRRAGRDGRRRRDAPDRGHGRVQAASAAVRLSQRHDDEADLPDRARRARREEARRVRGGRGRARVARGSDHRRREAREADPDRPPVGDRAPYPALRAAPDAGRRFHRRQHRARRALPRLLADVLQDDGAQGHQRAARACRDAPPHDADRLDAGEEGRSGRDDLRHDQHHAPPPALHRPGDRQAPGLQRLRGDERPRAAGPPDFPGRHARERRSDPGGAGRDHDHGRRGSAPVRHRAEGRAAVALQFRDEQRAVRAEDARYARDPAGTRAGTEGRRRDARRRRARRGAAQGDPARIDARGRREPADPAEHRFGEHRVQPVEDGRRQQHRDRADPVGRRAAGARADRIGDRSPHRQYGGAAGRRRERVALTQHAGAARSNRRGTADEIVNKGKKRRARNGHAVGYRAKALSLINNGISPLRVMSVARRQISPGDRCRRHFIL
ncbi:NADP-dependent malic enzyme [Burkholderia vietnamiensis]